MARFYTTSKGEFVEPFDPGKYGFEGETGRKRTGATAKTETPGLGNFEVLPQDVNVLDNRVTDYQKRINELTAQIQENPKAARQLAPAINELSLEIGSDVRAGDIYHMLNRKSEYDRIVKNLEDVFEDRPDLLQYALDQIEIPPLYDENGKYTNIIPPAVTDPWSNTKEQKLFKGALEDLDPTLKKSEGWQKAEGIDDLITTVYERSDTFGKSAKDIAAAIKNRMSVQDRMAILQDYLAIGYSPEEAETMLNERIGRFANSIAGVTKVQRDKVTVKDEEKLIQMRADARAGAGGPDEEEVSFVADRIRAMANEVNETIKDETISYTDDGDIIPKKQVIGSKVVENLNNLFIGKEFAERKGYRVVDIVYDPNKPLDQMIQVKFANIPENLTEDQIAQFRNTLPSNTQSMPFNMEFLRSLLGETEANTVYGILKKAGFVAENANTFNWWQQNQETTSATQGTTQGTPSATQGTTQQPPQETYGRVEVMNDKTYTVYDKRNANLEKYYDIKGERRVNNQGKTEFYYDIPKSKKDKLDPEILNPNIDVKEKWIKEAEAGKVKALEAIEEIFTNDLISPQLKDGVTYTIVNPKTGEREKLTAEEYKKLRKDAEKEGVLYLEDKNGTVNKFDKKEKIAEADAVLTEAKNYYEANLSPERIQEQRQKKFDEEIAKIQEKTPDRIITRLDSVRLAQELGLETPELPGIQGWESAYITEAPEESWTIVSENVTEEEINQKQLRKFTTPDNNGQVKYKLEKNPDGTYTLYERG